MLAQTNEALNTVNLIITGAVSIVLAWLSIQRNRDKKEAETRHQEAQAERTRTAESVQTVETLVRPRNGHDTLGEALEAIEKRINEMAERLARGDTRFDNMEQNEERIAEQLAIVISRLQMPKPKKGGN